MPKITINVKDKAGHSAFTTTDYSVVTSSSPTYGYSQHPQWPGSFTGGTFLGGFQATAGKTYMFCDFRGGVDVGSTSTSANNVKFIGCRFQFSANVSNQGDISSAQALLWGDNITFDYCTFQPSVTNYPNDLTGEEVKSNRSTYVEYGKGYQYAIVGSGGWNTKVGTLLVDHCNFWGFGNALELSGSTVAKPHVVRNSWFHHGADPFVENNTSAQIHNDCWLVNGGNYYGARCENNVMEIWGNTNLLAWQGSGAFSDAVITGNKFSGDQESISISSFGTSQRVTFKDNIFSTRIGRSVGAGRPLRGWFVSDSGKGSLWRNNKWMVASNAAVSNYPNANWGNPSWNGKFWWPGDSDSSGAHATDFTG